MKILISKSMSATAAAKKAAAGKPPKRGEVNPKFFHKFADSDGDLKSFKILKGLKKVPYCTAKAARKGAKLEAEGFKRVAVFKRPKYLFLEHKFKNAKTGRVETVHD